MSRYRAIADYLANLRKSSVRLSFTKIEQLIGAKLPKSASRYAAWWANSKSKDSHTWAHEWRRAGWKTAHLDLPGRAVTFHRLRQAKRPKRAKHAIRLISVNKNYWDGIPEKHQEVTEALLPMAKNEVPYTFTGKSSPKLQEHDTLIFRFRGLLLGEGKFLKWKNADRKTMVYQPLLQYRERLVGSHFFNYGASGYAQISLSVIANIRAAARKDTGPYVETGEGKSSTTHRIGQGKVRQSALERYERRCCLCSIDEPRLLVAGHIQGWAKGEDARGNPKNVVLMCALHDSLFGRGFITLSPGTFTLKISKRLSAGARKQIERFSSKFRKPENFPPAREFLTWHYTHLFER